MSKNQIAKYKYKDYSYDQGVFLQVFFDKQILPETFEYCLNYLVDNKIDLTVFYEEGSQTSFSSVSD